jgi:hypothetical protein
MVTIEPMARAPGRALVPQDLDPLVDERRAYHAIESLLGQRREQ